MLARSDDLAQLVAQGFLDLKDKIYYDALFIIGNGSGLDAQRSLRAGIKAFVSGESIDGSAWTPHYKAMEDLLYGVTTGSFQATEFGAFAATVPQFDDTNVYQDVETFIVANDPVGQVRCLKPLFQRINEAAGFDADVALFSTLPNVRRQQMLLAAYAEAIMQLSALGMKQEIFDQFLLVKVQNAVAAIEKPRRAFKELQNIGRRLSDLIATVAAELEAAAATEFEAPQVTDPQTGRSFSAKDLAAWYSELESSAGESFPSHGRLLDIARRIGTCEISFVVDYPATAGTLNGGGGELVWYGRCRKTTHSKPTTALASTHPSLKSFPLSRVTLEFLQEDSRFIYGYSAGGVNGNITNILGALQKSGAVLFDANFNPNGGLTDSERAERGAQLGAVREATLKHIVGLLTDYKKHALSGGGAIATAMRKLALVYAGLLASLNIGFGDAADRVPELRTVKSVLTSVGAVPSKVALEPNGKWFVQEVHTLATTLKAQPEWGDDVGSSGGLRDHMWGAGGFSRSITTCALLSAILPPGAVSIE